MSALDIIFSAWTAVLDPGIILIFCALTAVDAVFYTIIDRFLV